MLEKWKWAPCTFEDHGTNLGRAGVLSVSGLWRAPWSVDCVLMTCFAQCF